MVDTWVALGIVLAAIVACRLVLRVLGLDRGPTRGRGVRVESSCALGPRQRLHVVEVEGIRLLLGATDQSVRVLRRLPEPRAAEAEDADAAPRRGPWLRRLASRPLLPLALLAAGLGLPDPAFAQGAVASLPLDLEAAVGPERISTTLEIVALLTVVSIAPSVLLMATCFTRVIIVLALLRQAIGVQQLPPTQVLVGLALAITLFAMAPLGETVRRDALDPYTEGAIPAEVALERTHATVRGHLLRYTREKDLALFVSVAGTQPGGPEDLSLTTVLPAFMISELRTAFEIGFTMFLPFLVIDLVIASLLISMQMIVLPPIIISLPFKLMLFVLLDGWNLIVSALLRGLG